MFAGEQLQRVQIKLSSMQRCENISIPTVNSICTEPAYLTDDCNVRIKHYFEYFVFVTMLEFICISASNY